MDKSFKCSKCDYVVSFSTEEDVLEHLRTAHPPQHVNGSSPYSSNAAPRPLPLFPTNATVLPNW